LPACRLAVQTIKPAAIGSANRENVLVAGRDDVGRDLVHVVEGERAWSDQGGHSLGMFGVGDAFEEAVGGKQDWDCNFGTIEILREAGAVAGAGFAEEYGADGRSGA